MQRGALRLVQDNWVRKGAMRKPLKPRDKCSPELVNRADIDLKYDAPSVVAVWPRNGRRGDGAATLSAP